jgi:AraC-like DNA-binding protein
MSLYRWGGSDTMTINVAIPPKSADTGQSAGTRRRRQQSLALPKREGGTHPLPTPAHVFAKGRDTRHHPDRSLDTSSDKIWSGCKVVGVSPLIRELLSVCSQQPWDYLPASRSSHLAQVLLEQLEVHEQAPLELPELSDPRAKRVAAMLRADPADRRPLAELASAAGASHRTIERLFATETRMSFGRWRLRHRMITALEKLANGDSVSNVAFAVGYESPSSFIAAFKDSFGTTPTSYFENMHNRRVSKQ